jgi:sterol desaturase/sphingolipid hydroxylase (fatty acid hydroxylase superfamily)
MLLTTNFLGMFQHANIKTPHWLGYIIQRPESHTIHHAQGIHRYNYSDLPIYDIIFGTFRNPNSFEHQTGFYHGASARVGDMLMFRDVSNSREQQRQELESSTHNVEPLKEVMS